MTTCPPIDGWMSATLHTALRLHPGMQAFSTSVRFGTTNSRSITSLRTHTFSASAGRIEWRAFSLLALMTFAQVSVTHLPRMMAIGIAARQLNLAGTWYRRSKSSRYLEINRDHG